MSTLKNVQFVKDGIRQAVHMKELLGPLVGSPRLRGLWPQPAVWPDATRTPEPAVPVRRSVQPDHLVCLVCGKKQKLLKRHLAAEHELTPDEYRQRFGLQPDYPMMAPNYANQRRELALSIASKKQARRRRKSTARPAAAKS